MGTSVSTSITHKLEHVNMRALGKIMEELPIIQKTYDLIKWYVPILNRLPKLHKFALGDRTINGLYNLLEGLLVARYNKEKLKELESLQSLLDILRYQTRLLFDFQLMPVNRYEYAGKLINEIGIELGGWIKQQKKIVKPQTGSLRGFE